MACKGVKSFKGLEEASKHQKGTSTVYLLLWNKQLVSFSASVLSYKKMCYYNLYPHNNVFFYSAWIEESHIKPYQEFKDTLVKSSKSGAFKDAVEAIEEFIAKGEVSFIFCKIFM